MYKRKRYVKRVNAKTSSLRQMPNLYLTPRLQNYLYSLPRQIYSRNPNYPITMQGNNQLRVTPRPSPRPSIQVSPRGTPHPSPLPSRKASRILITKDFMKKDVDIEEDIEVGSQLCHAGEVRSSCSHFYERFWQFPILGERSFL